MFVLFVIDELAVDGGSMTEAEVEVEEGNEPDKVALVLVGDVHDDGAGMQLCKLDGLEVGAPELPFVAGPGVDEGQLLVEEFGPPESNMEVHPFDDELFTGVGGPIPSDRGICRTMPAGGSDGRLQHRSEEDSVPLTMT